MRVAISSQAMPEGNKLFEVPAWSAALFAVVEEPEARMS
jgi:hypothetical protein